MLENKSSLRTGGTMLLGLVVLVATFCVVGPARAQEDPDKVEIVLQEVAPGLYMLTGSGGNLAVSVGSDGVFLVDDQYAPLTAKIQAAIAKVSEAPVRFVVNTHWHGDHTGGNENLGKTGTVIVAHDNVRQRMSTDQFIEHLKWEVPASPPIALPVITFADAVTLHLNGDDVHVFHVAPAHTDGDSVVHFAGADVIHLGDLFFNGMYPFIDLSSGGSFAGVLAAVEQVLALCDDDTKLIPGHGPLASVSDLRSYRDMLAAANSAVGQLIAEGKSRDEVLAAKPLAAYDATLGAGFIAPDAFLGVIYDSLSSAR